MKRSRATSAPSPPPWTTNLTAAVDAHRAALDAELQAYGPSSRKRSTGSTGCQVLRLPHLAQINYKDPKKADTYFRAVTKAKKAASPRHGASDGIADCLLNRRGPLSRPPRGRRGRKQRGNMRGNRKMTTASGNTLGIW